MFMKKKEDSRNEKNKILTIRISVRNLVEFIMRTGDLDNRQGSRIDKEAMQKGSRIHRKLQRRAGSGYEAEVSLKHTIERERFTLILEGRADGILTEEAKVTVDEIKGVYKELRHIEIPVPVHLAQAKCYAYIYGLQRGLQEITVRMTYCHMDTEQIKYFYETYSFEELKQWFDELIREYEKWAAFQSEWMGNRERSIHNLHFPFEYREGQKDLVSGVYRTIQQKKKLFIQASTGVGKTISTVYPAVRAIGEGIANKIFYLTAKTITRVVAQETFQLLTEQALQFKVITITAKEKMCVCEEMNCNPIHCVRAKGHFDRINDAVYDLLHADYILSRERILEYAEKHQVCPYEMCLDTAIWADAVICDYNYVFDYNIYLKRFFSDAIKDDYIFLIDEAHNLLERGREMYSAVLYKEEFLKLKRDVKQYNTKLESCLEQCNKILLGWKKECETCEVISYAAVGTLSHKLVQLMSEIENFLEEVGEEEIRKRVLDFYFAVRHFINIYDCVDENYILYTEFDQHGFKIRLFCVNPSVNLNHFLEKGIATVFFSATLLPIQYYMKLLSGNLEDYTMYAESSFDKKQRLLLLGTDVSSKYTRRNQREYDRIATYLHQIVLQKTGNYIVFFPSYAYMDAVYQCFLAKHLSIDCLLQSNRMTERLKEDFLEEFQKPRIRSLIGFCVLGGIFSEGIDLKYDTLIGTIIVGTGLPQICTEKELLRKYFDQTEGNGFDYAYRFAGFNKVLQAAGRVIRTEEDKGVIVLLDERFFEPVYQTLFPKEWGKIGICNVNTIRSKIHDFWNGIAMSDL